MFTIVKSSLQQLDVETDLQFYLTSKGEYSDVTCNKEISPQSIENIVCYITEEENVPFGSIVRIQREFGFVVIKYVTRNSSVNKSIKFNIKEEFKRFHPDLV